MTRFVLASPKQKNPESLTQRRGVSRCIIDHAFSLEFYEGEQAAVLRIEGDFTISDRDRVYRLSPSVPMELGPAVALFGQVEGKLELAFEDGRTLSVEPDACYEAWEVSGPDGMRAVCTPGGAISVWQPKGS